MVKCPRKNLSYKLYPGGNFVLRALILFCEFAAPLAAHWPNQNPATSSIVPRARVCRKMRGAPPPIDPSPRRDAHLRRDATVKVLEIAGFAPDLGLQLDNKAENIRHNHVFVFYTRHATHKPEHNDSERIRPPFGMLRRRSETLR